MLSCLDDYMDGDVAYFIGLLVARGTISEGQGLRQITIEFPYSSLRIEGITSSFDQEKEIQLGMNKIRERLLDLLNADISIISKEGGVDLVIRFMRNNMIWRNILLITNKATSYPFFRVPPIFFNPDLPKDWKREFVRGYADVAGNIRKANRYVDGRHRVRLDVLNYPTNWEVPVQLCTLLQEHLDVPVQLIAYGHPNLKRGFREHMVNIFAKPFLQIGFSFEHKQQILEELAAWNPPHAHAKEAPYSPCPGMRKTRERKPADPNENNSDKLDSRLVGHHYDAYWQICKALGCKRLPTKETPLTEPVVEEDETASSTNGEK